MTYNAGNRKNVRALEKQSKLETIARHEVIRGLMSTIAGRQWVYDRLTACHIFSTSFSLEALEMAFREGERNAGLQILTDVMQVSPDEYVQMMREANVRHLTTDARLSGSNPANPGRDDQGSVAVSGGDLDGDDYNDDGDPAEG